MLLGKLLVVSVLVFGFIIVLAVAVLRIWTGEPGGLSLISATILLPLIIGIIYGYNENTLNNLRTWLFNTPKKRIILIFSMFFWYIGVMSILSYSLYDNLTGNITFVATGGFLLGYASYQALLKLM